MPRMSRNSQDSALPVASFTSTASSTTCTSSVAVAPTVPTSLTAPASPELVASLIEAMKAPLSSMVHSALLSAGISRSPVPSTVVTTGLAAGNSSTTHSIAGQTTYFGQAGSSPPWSSPSSTGLQSSLHVASTSGSVFSASGLSGMSNTSVVPSFVHSFAPLQSNVVNGAIGGSIQSPTLAPALQQPFVIGPGYSPVPYKVVSQIILGKYVNFEDLLPENISMNEPEPQLLFEGRLVFSPAPKKNKRQITDIVTWLEAFSIFSLILGSYFPNRWVDLVKYKLLILRTYRQFSGSAWLNYDKEFREQAAAERKIEWAVMNVQLYNFHTAGAYVRPRVSASSQVPSGREAYGTPSSKVMCYSWNAGHCIAPSSQCRFCHACSNCAGEHRSISCSSRSRRPERTRSVEPADLKRKKRF